MNKLDNLDKIKILDKSNLLGSVQELYLQFDQTSKELKKVSAPQDYQNINKVVLNGMGGSRLGARVAQRMFENELKVPIIPVGNYNLPEFVDDKTLLIFSSYSGNTEEIISSINQGLSKKAKIMVFSQSGKLTKLAEKRKLPGYYNFQPKHNPSNQPRMSIGYQILGIIILLSRAGLLKLKDEKIKKLSSFIKKIKQENDYDVKKKNNLAKKTALSLQTKVPVLIGAEFIMGALHVWRNQINENAKQLSFYFEIPELNHHLLEGLQFPKNNTKNFYFVFVKSSLYHQKNQQRIEITKKVLDKYKFKYSEINLTGKDKLEQVFEIIQIGSFASFYMAMLNNLDPTPIPWVDYFKKELKNNLPNDQK
jgi:glucose/mannose-6-phosphate isomerase